MTQLDGEGTVVVVGDVVGHGIAAAMLMASARGILRSHVGETPSLAELLVQTNEHLVEDVGVGSGNFMTLLVLSLDRAGGKARWASAGHDPPFAYDPTADAFMASGRGGLALGLMDGVTYPEHELPPMRPGQVILVATDGVWETFNESQEMYGKERLREFIRRNAAASADEIADRLLAELEAYRGDASQDDDVTYVVVKVR
jgi:sigma-B regulation protein RsbU (phosphoserine phosphatase)